MRNTAQHSNLEAQTSSHGALCPAPDERPQWLYTRVQAAERLGCSIDLIKRMEKSGALKPVRLTSARGQVFIRHADLIRVAEMGGV